MTCIIEAERVIALHQKKAPVQTLDIAQELGIKVFKVNDWPDNVSAMIRKDAERGGESGFAVYVNSSHPRVRRRFRIEHEVGAATCWGKGVSVSVDNRGIGRR